jgi:Xaa-Pro aminopeptidase
MEQKGLEAVVVYDPKNLYYFAGLEPQRVTSAPALLLAQRREEPRLIIGETDLPRVLNVFGGEIKFYKNYDLNRRMVAYPNDIPDELRGALGSQTLNGVVGIETWGLPPVILRALKNVAAASKMVDVSHVILEMRQVKDPDEVELIRRSCEIHDFAYSYARTQSAPGKSELQVYAATHSELTEKMGVPQYFGGDFVSGERTLQVGGPPTHRLLQKGDTLILDLAATNKSYWADSCRTFIVGSAPSREQSKIFEVLIEALAAGEDKLCEGYSGKDVYTAVFQVLDRAGYGKRFPHHAGHGLGLEAWEPPFLIPGSNQEIRRGMVCAIEPGVYVPGVGGIRLENDYLVTGHKPESLTKHPLEP